MKFKKMLLILVLLVGHMICQTQVRGAIEGSGTADRIPKFTGSTTIGNSAIYEKGGRVGIGTISPASQLSLGSSTARTKLALYETGPNNSYGLGVVPGAFRLHLNGPGARFAFFDSAALGANEIFTIKGSGNVGIGTTSPASQLSLGSSTARTKLALYETGPNNSYGLGVMPGAFRLHLNGPGARFAFLDSAALGANEIFTIKGNGTARMSVLEITGGADLSEQFKIGTPDVKSSPSSGMVVSIDPENPGDLIVSNKAYDRRVAGIISGAGGVKPGMLMSQKGSKADGTHAVALTGRVYCWVDASNGKIQPGDLLTTSNTLGHAMKVTDYTKAQGAILGKAMSSLNEGKGLVLALVSLQ